MDEPAELTLSITAADYDRLMKQSPEERRDLVAVALGPVSVQMALVEVGSISPWTTRQHSPCAARR